MQLENDDMRKCVEETKKGMNEFKISDKPIAFVEYQCPECELGIKEPITPFDESHAAEHGLILRTIYHWLFECKKAKKR